MTRSMTLIAAMAALFILPSQGNAVDARIKSQLLKLDPRTRLEQACDTEAMLRIKAETASFRPDKVVAYTFQDPTYGKDWIAAPGAVFRSRGEWYHLSFQCRTGPKHVHVRQLDYQIGHKVARTKWEKYFLYD